VTEVNKLNGMNPTAQVMGLAQFLNAIVKKLLTPQVYEGFLTNNDEIFETVDGQEFHVIGRR
jgi:hypothetical protein